MLITPSMRQREGTGNIPIELAVAWAEDILTFFLTTSALFELGERKKGERSRELSVN